MIDTHIHVVPPRLPGAGPLSPLLNQSVDVVVDALRQEIRSARLEHVLAMGQLNAGLNDPLGIKTSLKIAERLPHLRLIGVADPRFGNDAEHLKQVEQQLQHPLLIALKCYLGYLHFEPSHDNYLRYYELAAHYKKPVIFHTGDTFSPAAKLKYAHPLGIDDVAVDFPDCQFVMAHVGNPWMIDAAEVVYKNLNVWVDMSGLVVGDADVFADDEEKDRLADVTTNLRKAFRYAERPNRFLFGSDWPLVPIAAYKKFIASVIPIDYHEQIFKLNAGLLFKV